MSAALSRPKIHRLPNLPPQKKPFYAGLLRMRGALLLSVLLLGTGWVVTAAIKPLLPRMFGHTAAIPQPVPVARLTANVHGNTIVIQDKSEQIVGQLAKFPPQNEQITEVKSASDVDAAAGRELLSIISKY